MGIAACTRGNQGTLNGSLDLNESCRKEARRAEAWNDARMQVDFMKDVEDENSRNVAEGRCEISIIELASLSLEHTDCMPTVGEALSLVTGTHVCFVAEGDSLQPGIVECATEYLRKYKNDLLQLPVFESWNPEVRHPQARRFGRSSASFRPSESSSKVPLSLFGMVLSRSLLEKLELSSYALEADGVEVVYKALGVCSDVGFCWSEAGYLKSKRKKISVYNPQNRTIDQVRRSLSSLESAVSSSAPQSYYQKALIAHGLLDCCSGADPDILFGAGADSVRERVKLLARLISAKYVLTGKSAGLYFEQRALLFKLQGRSFSKELMRGRYANFSIVPVKIGSISVEGDVLIIETLHWAFGAKGVALDVFDAEGRSIEPASIKTLHSSFDCKVGEWNLSETVYSVFKVPLAESMSLGFCWVVDGETCPAACELVSSRSRFVLQDDHVPVRFGRYGISYRENRIHVSPSPCFGDGLKKSTAHIEQTYDVDAGLRLRAASDKCILLLSDRPEQAGDNAYALFDYIMRYAPQQVRDNTFYAIRSTAVDFGQLAHRDHVVEFGSDRHKELFINARLVYSSHIDRAFVYPFAQDEYKYYADLLSFEFVWLQHGITKDDVSGVNNRFFAGVDYAITATRNEYESFLTSQYFYRPEKVLLTGFPRFDLLENGEENIITIMPTWRRYLSSASDALGARKPKQEFEHSEYFRQWSAVLSDARLRMLLEQSDFKLVFLVHPAFKCYESNFRKFESERVLIDPPTETYRSLYAKSQMVVTDYSSAVFDFAYLNKPLVYFQFDEKDFFSKHATSSFFSYKNDGLGPIVRTVNDLIDAIEGEISSGFAIGALYKERASQFFAFNDKDNCKRVFERTCLP